MMRCSTCGTDYDAAAVDGCEKCGKRRFNRLGSISWNVNLLLLLIFLSLITTAFTACDSLLRLR